MMENRISLPPAIEERLAGRELVEIDRKSVV